MSIKILLSATLILLGLSLNCVRALADEIPQKISAEEALDLTYEVTKKHNPEKGSLDYSGQSDREKFFKFQGLGPVAGSYGFFAVNPWTGDVWALWGCKRQSTPSLRKRQAKIRQRFSPEEAKSYQKLRDIRPECITD